jgi:hypothetical protein
MSIIDEFYFVAPVGAAPAGYDWDGTGAILRMRVPKGGSKEVALVGPADQLGNLIVSSSNPSIVKNEDIKTRVSGKQAIITLTGSIYGTTFLDVRRKSSGPPSLADRSLKADSEAAKKSDALEAKRGIGAVAARAIAAAVPVISLQVQVTRKDGTMPRDYSGIAAEGQLDATACWAACFAWWLKAAPGRTPKPQIDILKRASGLWGSDGTLSWSAVKRFYEGQNAKITCDTISAPDFDKFVVEENLPLILGHKSGPQGGGHVHVIHAINPATNEITAMEPWSPQPDNSYTLERVQGQWVIVNKIDGSPFKFTGAHVKWPPSYYKMRELPTGGFLVCRPS